MHEHTVAFDQWRSFVLDTAVLARPKSRRMATLDAHGARLSEPLVARESAPAFSMSAMDGFAARSSDLRALLLAARDAGTQTQIDVTADIAAGSPMVGQPRSGAAVRIMTGASVPEDFDVVIPVELTDADQHAPEAPSRITLTQNALERGTALYEPGTHIRAAGEEIAAGEHLATPGTVLTSQLIGIALAVGITTVEVELSRKVAIIMTGDELVTEDRAEALRDVPGHAGSADQSDGISGSTGNTDQSHDPLASTGSPSQPHNAPGHGAVLESNGPMLAAALAELGADSSIHHVADSPADLIGLARSLASRHDLIITTGGVGSGARDVVKAAFGPGTIHAPGLGCSRFEHIHMRPGGPQGAGRLPLADGSTTPMIHLPGTPVGALVGFHLFARPVLGGGRESWQTPSANMRLAPTNRPAKPGTTVRPASLSVDNGALIATEIPGPRLRPFTHADALIVSDGGDTVTVTPLP